MKLFQILTGLVLALAASAANACSCFPLKDTLVRSGVVVLGTIAEDELDGVVSPFGAHSTRLIPERVWFGPKLLAYSLLRRPSMTPDGFCGGAFVGKPGDKVLIGLYPEVDGRWKGGHCSLVHPNSHGTVGADLDAYVASNHAALDEHLKDNPNDLAAWEQRAAQAAAMQQRYRRLESLRRIVELSPSPPPEILTEAAELSAHYLEFDRAKTLFERAIAVRPDARARGGLNQVNLRLSYDKALWDAAKQVEGIIWRGVQRETRLDGVTISYFAISNSGLRNISNSRLNAGQLNDVRMEGIDDVVMKWVIARKVSFGRMHRVRLLDWHIADATFEEYFGEGELKGEVVLATFRARIVDVDMRGTSLRDVDFSGSSIYGVRFDRARLRNVDFSKIVMGKNLSFTNTYYDCATRLPADVDPVIEGMIAEEASCDGRASNRDFTGSGYRHVRFWINASLDGARFVGRHFDYAEFRDVSLRNADLSHVKMDDGSFERADLRGSVLRGAVLKGVQFSNSDLRGTDLSGVELRDYTVSILNFSLSKYDAATRWPATYVDRKGERRPFVPSEHGAELVQ